MLKLSHLSAFKQAADRNCCWIGLREPNQTANYWIGREGCIPKNRYVKAKTADAPGHPLAGLVVDPHQNPAAFKKSTLPRAYEKWDDFIKELPHGISITSDRNGKRHGLVLLNGKAIHADYDLMFLIRSNEQGDWLNTSQLEQARLYQKVSKFINTSIRTPMIQHGTEFMYKKGVGAAEAEIVHCFGPGGRVTILNSSMPKSSETWH